MLTKGSTASQADVHAAEVTTEVFRLKAPGTG
jgi:hypothetical protein